MSFFINLFKSKPVAPERVPTDVVIPVHGYDDTKTNRALYLDFSMRFDDVLDVERLVSALERLLEKPGWRKFGARLRLNVCGPQSSFSESQNGQLALYFDFEANQLISE